VGIYPAHLGAGFVENLIIFKNPLHPDLKSGQAPFYPRHSTGQARGQIKLYAKNFKFKVKLIKFREACKARSQISKRKRSGAGDSCFSKARSS
jgi:hypothetical protein